MPRPWITGVSLGEQPPGAGYVTPLFGGPSFDAGSDAVYYPLNGEPFDSRPLPRNADAAIDSVTITVCIVLAQSNGNPSVPRPSAISELDAQLNLGDLNEFSLSLSRVHWGLITPPAAAGWVFSGVYNPLAPIPVPEIRAISLNLNVGVIQPVPQQGAGLQPAGSTANLVVIQPSAQATYGAFDSTRLEFRGHYGP